MWGRFNFLSLGSIQKFLSVHTFILVLMDQIREINFKAHSSSSNRRPLLLLASSIHQNLGRSDETVQVTHPWSQPRSQVKTYSISISVIVTLPCYCLSKCYLRVSISYTHTKSLERNNCTWNILPLQLIRVSCVYRECLLYTLMVVTTPHDVTHGISGTMLVMFIILVRLANSLLID